MNYPLSNPSIELPQRLGTPPDALLPQASKALLILQRLQTTLDIGQLLEIFANALSDIVAVDGILYELPELEISFSSGRQSRHSCAYRLCVEEQDLGRLAFRRGRRFREAEMAQLEELICSLVYPLRNAMLYQRAVRYAHRDPLTGLHNRTALNTSFSREVGLAERYRQPLSILVIDIDKFKAVNDRHGHAAGDRLLAHVASEIVANVRSTDLANRYGGEEFVVLLSNTTKDGAVLVAERIRQGVARSQCTLADGTVLSATVSIGVEQSLDLDSAVMLFERADRALYRAKHEGRNTVRVA